MTLAARGLIAFAIAVAIAFVAFAAVVGSSSDRSTYGADLAEIVTGACDRTGDGASSSECACAYERLSTELSFEEFEALDDDLDDLNDPPQEIVDAVAACEEGESS